MNMDSNGTTEFMWACSRGDHLLVKHIMKHEDVYLNHVNEFGETALTLAIKGDRINIIKMLLNYDYEKVDVNHIDKTNRCALHLLSECFTHSATLNLLLNCNDINLNIKDIFEWTPIMYACYVGNSNFVKQIFEIDGLDLCLRNNEWMTAYDIAISDKCPKMMNNFHRDRIVSLFKTRHDQGTFLTSEYIQLLRLPLICKELSGEIASYLSWEDVSPRKRAPANILAENQHLMTKYTKQFS